MKILGIGNALVDMIVHLDTDDRLKTFQLERGSMTLVDSNRSEGIRQQVSSLPSQLASGGSAANTIHGLARLGTSSGFVGSIGHDPMGELFRKELEEQGVHTYLRRLETPTGMAVSLVSPDSERTFATCLGAAVQLDAGMLDFTDFADYDLLYMEGYLLANEAFVRSVFGKARGQQMKIALDMSSYNIVEQYLPLYKELISSYVDIVFANEEEATAYTGKQNPAEALAVLAGETDLAVVKTGPRGSLIRSGEQEYAVQAFPSEVIDTTGAGDLYAAGFLHGLSRNLPLEKCGKLASLVASRVIRQNGARIPEAAWQEIEMQIERL